MDKTNSYTTPDPRDVNPKIPNEKAVKKTKKTPCDILYNRKNSASPDATDPPVPNRAHTEMQGEIQLAKNKLKLRRRERFHICLFLREHMECPPATVK